MILCILSAVVFLRCKSQISCLKFKMGMMWVRSMMAVWCPKENEINPVRMTSAPKVLIMLEGDTLWLQGTWWKQELVSCLCLVSVQLAPVKELTNTAVFQESKNKDSCADRRSDVVWVFFWFLWSNNKNSWDKRDVVHETTASVVKITAKNVKSCKGR